MNLSAEQAQQVDASVSEYIDSLAAEMYNVTARSPREMTPERWAEIKQKFPGSVRRSIAEVERLHSRDIKAFRADLILALTQGATPC